MNLISWNPDSCNRSDPDKALLCEDSILVDVSVVVSEEEDDDVMSLPSYEHDSMRSTHLSRSNIALSRHKIIIQNICRRMESFYRRTLLSGLFFRFYISINYAQEDIPAMGFFSL